MSLPLCGRDVVLILTETGNKNISYFKIKEMQARFYYHMQAALKHSSFLK